MAIDLNQRLSSSFLLSDFLGTDQALASPNEPTSQTEVTNLTYLADVMENVLDDVGPFQILSGFRTHELQVALGEGGNPVSAGVSFHEVGRAIDIYPASMPLDVYFGLILADSYLLSKFAEVSIKPSQNSIHLAVNVPGDTRTTKILGLDSGSNTYGSLDDDSIQGYIDQAKAAIASGAVVIAENPVPVVVLGVLVVGLAYFLMKK